MKKVLAHIKCLELESLWSADSPFHTLWTVNKLHFFHHKCTWATVLFSQANASPVQATNKLKPTSLNDQQPLTLPFGALAFMSSLWRSQNSKCHIVAEIICNWQKPRSACARSWGQSWSAAVDSPKQPHGPNLGLKQKHIFPFFFFFKETKNSRISKKCHYRRAKQVMRKHALRSTLTVFFSSD